MRFGPFGWVAMTLASATVLATPELPLTVGPFSSGPKPHVQLTNNGNQPVTAWSLATVTQGADGRKHREIEIVDGYLSEVTAALPNASPRLNRILPGESREFELEAVPAGATLEVAAVVLDDGTAVGDEQVIAAIFERRLKEREALAAVVGAFNDVLATAAPAQAIDALRDRLEGIVQRDPSIPCRAALEAVETYKARRTDANVDETMQSLRRYAAFVTSEYELAQKHSQRKR